MKPQRGTVLKEGMYILSNNKEKGIQLIMGFPFIKDRGS